MSLTEKENKLKNLLSYLATRRRYGYYTPFPFVRKNNNEFEILFSININKPEEIKERDEHSTVIDFDKCKVFWYAYNISGHNGDHYNYVSGEFPWDEFIDAVIPQTLKLAQDEICAEIKNEENEKIIDIRKKLVCDRLNQLISQGHNIE